MSAAQPLEPVLFDTPTTNRRRPRRPPSPVAEALLRVDQHLHNAHLAADHPARLEIARAIAAQRGGRRQASTDTPPVDLCLMPLLGSVQTQLCVPDDELHHVPDWLHMPLTLPPAIPVPKKGDALFLSSTSAWGVKLVVHEWLRGGGVRVEIWLSYLGPARHVRPAECQSTH